MSDPATAFTRLEVGGWFAYPNGEGTAVGPFSTQDQAQDWMDEVAPAPAVPGELPEPEPAADPAPEPKEVRPAPAPVAPPEKKAKFVRVLCVDHTKDSYLRWLQVISKRDDIICVKYDRLRIGDRLLQFTYVGQPEDLLGCDVVKNVVLILPAFRHRESAWRFTEYLQRFQQARVITVNGYYLPSF